MSEVGDARTTADPLAQSRAAPTGAIETLAFTVQGHGPDLLLVHGTGSTGLGSWGSILERLTGSHRVILIDLPGSGGSAPCDQPLEVTSIAARIEATATAAGADRFAIAGISLGAPLALVVAASYPQRVTSLVSLFGYSRARASLVLRLDAWRATAELSPEVAARTLVAQSFTDRHLDGLHAEALAQMLAFLTVPAFAGTLAQIDLARSLDVDEHLDRVSVPTLIVAGADDQMVHPSHAEPMLRLIAGAESLLIDGGHGAIIETPDLVADPMLRFLAEHAG